MAQASTNCLAGPCEPLDRHLREVAQCVGERGVAVAKKLARVFGVKPEEALDVLEFMALAHDVGKAAVRSEDNRYFKRHEAKSTTFMYEAMLKMGIPPSCRLGADRGGLAGLFTAALWAVALHHYYKSYEKGAATDFEPICLSYLKAFEEWKPRSEVGEGLRKAALELSYIRESSCHKDIVESIGRERGKLVYAASAMLGLLGECDNEVAGRNRCDDSSAEGGAR